MAEAAAGGTEPTGDSAQLDAVQQRLEELLSRTSLAEDHVIFQNINSQMYVPMYVLAAHTKVLSLRPTVTMQVILAAAKRSEHLEVDEETMMIRPVFKQRRNTLILRDLPDGTTEDELHSLFKLSSHCDLLTELKPDVNHTAFVTFETDEAAQDVALWLRSQKIRGEAVKCAVKSDHFMKSFFPAQPAGSAAQQAAGQGSWAGSGSPWTPALSWASPQLGPSYDESPQVWAGGGGGGWANDAKGKGSGKGKMRGKGFGKGPSVGASDDAESMAIEAQRQMEEAMGLQPGPLDGDEDEMDVGFKHEFRRYTRQEIVDICSAVEVIPKPDGFARFEKEHKDTGLFRQSPLKDWVPPPTPMAAFAASMLDAGKDARHDKRGTEEGEVAGDGGDIGRRRSKPGRKTSGSWPQGGRPLRKESGDNTQDGGGHSDWNEWDWPASGWGADAGGWGTEGGDSGWGAEAAGKGKGKGRPQSKRNWVQKPGEKDDAETQKEDSKDGGKKNDTDKNVDEDTDKKGSWAEKVRGLSSDKGAAPQKWTAKPKSEAAGASTTSSGAGQSGCPASESPKAAAAATN